MSPAPEMTPARRARSSPSRRAGLHRLFVFLILCLTFTAVAHAQLPPGFEEDLLENSDFENAATPLEFIPNDVGEGAVAHTTTNPITGTGSMKVTVNSFGRVYGLHEYGWGSGPFARSITFAAKVRVDSTTIPGRQVNVCAIAYFLDSSEPAEVCRLLPVDPNNVVDVRLNLDADERQLNYLYPQFELEDSGSIEVTVDDAHYYIDEAQWPTVSENFELVDILENNEFENPATPLEFTPNETWEGTVAHTTTNPILGTGSMKLTASNYGKVYVYHPYGWGSGPFAESVTFSAMLRVESTTEPGRQLQACAIAYFLDSPEPETACQFFSVDANNFVDVFVTVDAENRQLNYIFPLFYLEDSGTIEATVDEVHYWVVQPTSGSCDEDTWECGDWSECSSNGTRTRNCTMTFDCPNVNTPSPATEEECDPPQECTQDTWECSEWSTCPISGVQTRTCEMTFDCPNANTPSPELTQPCVPEFPDGPEFPSRQGGRYTAMMSPTNGETFWAPETSLRLVAQGFDPNVSTNDPVEGRGQNASQVEFFVDGNSVLTVSGTNAEYSVFKGYVSDIELTPGPHIVWARATYVNPALTLDTLPMIINVVEPPAYAQTVELTGDIVLSPSNPSYELEGTPSARIRLNGNGFQIRGSGDLTLRYIDVYDLGSQSDGLSEAIDVASSGSIVIEDSIFDSSNQVEIQPNGTAIASIRRNTFRSNSRIPVGQQPWEPTSTFSVEILGNSTGTKTFAGNNVAAGAVALRNAQHWMLGGTTDADSNVMIGVRTAFELFDTTNINIQGNFVRNVYYGGWSQGQLMELDGNQPIAVKHNILVGSSWPIRGIAGELAYNLVTNGGHTSLIPDNNAYVHHNIFLGCGGGDGGECDRGTIGGIYDVDARIVNNTFDMLNQGSIVAAVYQRDGEMEVRSNIFARTPMRDNFPNAAVIEIESPGTVDADYNAFYGPRPVRYGDGRMPANDIVGTNPNFTGPLPSTSMDMDQVAVWKRELTVSEVLADYRVRYTPAGSNPLTDSGDPAGGSGNDIGAIGSGSPNALDLFGTFGSTFSLAATHPTMPQNLYAAGISSDKVFLKWSPAASPVVPNQTPRSITSYRVFRDGVLIATVNDDVLRYEDSGLSADSTYDYAVVAVDSANKISPSATASATTIPTMPVGTISSHPVLISQARIAELAAGGAAWNTQKNWCDTRLNTLIRDLYAGWEWRDAAVNFSTCYQVAKLQNDTVNAEKYAKKALAMAIVLARHHNLGTPDDNHPDNVLQPVGLTDGTTTTFPLPFTPMNDAQVRVVLVGNNEIQLTRSAEEVDELGAFAPIMKISNTSNGANAYAPSDYELRFRDGSDIFRLAWIGSNAPATSANYFVTVANGAATTVASGVTVNSSNLTVTFDTAPAANQTVMVSYIGSNYEQTGNGLGGVNSVQPDGPGYQMRTYNPGLATAYDALLDSGLLTTALKTEFYEILNGQIEWCKDYCFENNGNGGQVGNYFIRGLLAGTFATAYATEGENPQAAQLKAQANTYLSQVYEGVVKTLPGGYGPQGQYANGVTSDVLEFLSLYNDVTGLDLAPRLDWTANVVPATIHGTKPNLVTFYDGGDWSNLPAYPLTSAMQGFLKFQSAHTMAPFARKLVTELNETPASTGTITDYRNSFPLSYFGQGAPFYARSDWGNNAVWMSLTANDTGAVAHQHKDAGHFTIQRGADYLLKTAGGYDVTDTLYHNSLLIDDRNIPGYNPVSVYPPHQGWWGSESQLTKHADAGEYTYTQADFADSYVNNDGERNSVKRALRSIVYFRPGTFVVFDQVQVANAGIRRTFNVNFGGTLTNSGGIWSATLNQSKLFMQSLLNSVTPTTSTLSGSNISTSTNFQETLSGNLKDVFLHVFEATSSSATAMTANNQMRSVDQNVQGVQVTADSKKWAVLFAAYDRAFGGPVQYVLPTTGAHGHLIHDLLPSSAYLVSVTNAQGDVQRTVSLNSDANGTLAFDTPNGETHFYVSPGTTPPSTIPPVTTDPNA